MVLIVTAKPRTVNIEVIPYKKKMFLNKETQSQIILMVYIAYRIIMWAGIAQSV